MMNKGIYTKEQKEQMADMYLIFGTFRKAESWTCWSKSTIHKAVNDFIENGGYDHIDELKEQVNTNKKERAIRGGKATAEKWKDQKAKIQS